ncbi:MAG: hypothetical protein M3131_05570, partial [Actinomycetota bacterium]|nr:hypothetical protein [Actinomycetota bacterium]
MEVVTSGVTTSSAAPRPGLGDAQWVRAAGGGLVAAAAAMALDQFGLLRFDLGSAWPVCCALAGIALLLSARDAEGEVFTGVIARLAGVRPGRRALLRAAVVALAPLAGLGAAVYAALALRQALGTATTPKLDWRRSVGSGLLCLAAVLAAYRASLVAGPEDVLWPVLLASSGLPLYWSSAGLRRPQSDGRLFADAELTGHAGLLLTATAAVYVLD